MSPMKRVRIDKGEVRRLSELEDHLYLLRQQYNDLTQDPAHLYVIAGELRALVCLSSGTEGLLWRLTEALGVSDVVSVRAVGGVDPDHTLAKGLRLFVPALMRPDTHSPPRLQCQDIEMKSLVKTCLGAYTWGKSFTHEQLIKKVAEQMGSAHIDDGIEPGLATMEELLVSGRPAYSSTLAILASLTLEVGERVIAAAVERGIFKRRRYSPPLTLSIHGSLLEIPLGQAPIVSFELYASAIRLDAYMTPQSFLYVISKRGRASMNLAVSLPKQWQVGEEAIFCLSYDHAAARLQVVGPNQQGDRREHCDVGFVWTSHLDWSEPQFHDVSAEYFRFKAFYVHSRILTPEDAAQVSGLLIERPDLELPD